MTDPYTERIAAMKRLERGSSVFVNITAECQDMAQATRNAERLAAYHEKRLRLAWQSGSDTQADGWKSFRLAP